MFRKLGMWLLMALVLWAAIAMVGYYAATHH